MIKSKIISTLFRVVILASIVLIVLFSSSIYLNKKIINIYKKKTKLSVDKINKFLLPPHDVWLTSDECLKYNIATHVKINHDV